jgi:hypothetical protein
MTCLMPNIDFRGWPALVFLLAALPVHADLFSCDGVTRPDARAVVSISDTSITVNGVPYVIEGADARFVYARLDARRADPIQRDYFPNRSLAVDRELGRIIEFKDQDRSFAEGNTVEWACRSVKSWTEDPD